MWLVIDRSKNFEYYLIGFKDFCYNDLHVKTRVKNIKTSAGTLSPPSPPYQDDTGKLTFDIYEPFKCILRIK